MSGPQEREELAIGAWLLRGFACDNDAQLRGVIDSIARMAPFRHMVTPGGFPMSVAMTNCGANGWVADEAGYRYAPLDPSNDQPWPPLPPVLEALATRAAELVGFAGFAPDACLVNRYEPGSRLTLHQDKDERDLSQPIVSVSLGVPAVFLFGGLKRKDPVVRVPLAHGDVVVWGGSSRLRYHGVATIRPAEHAFAGGARINLTLRRAG